MKKTVVKLLTAALLLLGAAIEQALAVNYNQLIPKPSRSNINQGLTSPNASYMKDVLGDPGALTTNCSSVTNPKLQKLIVRQNVGPFTVKGLKPAVKALQRIFAAVKREKPELYSQLGTAGMLCVRKVRGGANFSNHSWGTAIDIKINSKLDKFGDGKTQLGLKELYPYFHREGFYWGAGYSPKREDSMHFEASKELIAKWFLRNRTSSAPSPRAPVPRDRLSPGLYSHIGMNPPGVLYLWPSPWDGGKTDVWCDIPNHQMYMRAVNKLGHSARGIPDLERVRRSAKYWSKPCSDDVFKHERTQR